MIISLSTTSQTTSPQLFFTQQPRAQVAASDSSWGFEIFTISYDQRADVLEVVVRNGRYGEVEGWMDDKIWGLEGTAFIFFAPKGFRNNFHSQKEFNLAKGIA